MQDRNKSKKIIGIPGINIDGVKHLKKLKKIPKNNSKFLTAIINENNSNMSTKKIDENNFSEVEVLSIPVMAKDVSSNVATTIATSVATKTTTNVTTHTLTTTTTAAAIATTTAVTTTTAAATTTTAAIATNLSQAQSNSFTIDPDTLEFNPLTILGQGVSAKVFKACYKDNKNKNVAVKIRFDNDRRSLRKLREEEAILNIMNEKGSENIIKFYGTVGDAFHFGLVMDYINHGNVRSWIKNNVSLGRVSINEQLTIIKGIIFGVYYIHEANIIHCDLKSDNIGLKINENKEITPVILDFGFGIPADQKPKYRGSPAYMAPEVLDKNAQGKPADIYSMGCIFHEVISCQFISDHFKGMTSEQLKLAVVKHTKRPPVTGSFPCKIGDYIKDCFDQIPLNRPNALYFFKDVQSVTEDDMVDTYERRKKQHQIKT